ncbi:MAG TPA: restriction endonuclease subunit S [Verrucomicrobiae bacterium]
MNTPDSHGASPWKTRPFVECLAQPGIERPAKLLAREYKTAGPIPVIDQGQEFIAGWTTEEKLAIRKNLPFVVFGDHTRVFKFVNFPFALGADGTHLLKPAAAFNPYFFYFACLHLPLPNRGYNRHFTVLKEQGLPQPPTHEQEKIAAILWKIQRAIVIEEKLVATTRELKHSALHHLFAQGLRGEDQKQTDIGSIPQSWGLRALGELIDVTHGFAFKSEFFRETGPVVLTPGNFKLDGGLYWGENTKFTAEVCPDEFRFQARDLVVVMTDLTPSAKLLGSPAFIPHDRTILHNQRIGKVVPLSDKVRKEFLYWVFLTQPFKNHMVMTATGSTVRHTSPGRIRAFPCPIPPADEQDEICKILQEIDHKISVHERKRAILQDLFQTMLHQLMTAQIRVDKLDIDTSEVHNTL